MKREDQNLAAQKSTIVKNETILAIKTTAFFPSARRRKNVFRAVLAFLGDCRSKRLAVCLKLTAFGFALLGTLGTTAAADFSASFCELAGLQTDAATALDDGGWKNGYFDANFDFCEEKKGFNEQAPFEFRAIQLKRDAWASDGNWDAAVLPTIRGANLSKFAIDPFRGRFFGYVDGAWGTQFEQSDDPLESGFNVAAFGGGLGQDWTLGENVVGGFGLQGRRIDLDPSADMFAAKVDSFAGFLHMSVYGSLWRLDLAVGASKNWNEQTQTLGLDASNGGNNVVKNKFSSTQWNYEAEFGVRFDKGYTRIEPLVNFRVLTLQESREAEELLTSVLRPSDFSDASFRLKLGSRFSWEYATRFSTLKPFLIASWAHEFGQRSIYTIGDNTPYPVAYRYGKHRMARDRLNLGGGVDAALRDSVDLFFQYDVEIAADYADYLFFAGFNKKY